MFLIRWFFILAGFGAITMPDRTAYDMAGAVLCFGLAFLPQLLGRVALR